MTDRKPAASHTAPAKAPEFDVGATPTVIKRIAKGLAPGVRAAWEGLVRQLKKDPRFVVVDKKEVWGKAWKDAPNHRHADLPSAWRAAWTIRSSDGKERVTVLFLGTHKEYEELYGFRKH